MKVKKNKGNKMNIPKDSQKKRRKPKPSVESTFDRSGYTNTYIRANYDRLGILVPPGMKDSLKEEAFKRGTSVTGLIIDVLAEALKIVVEVPEKVKVEVPPLDKKKLGKRRRNKKKKDVIVVVDVDKPEGSSEQEVEAPVHEAKELTSSET